MKTIEGYSKEKYTDTSVLLAGGGAKALSDFIGSLTWDSTNKKITYTPVGGSATDLVSLSWSNISDKPDTFPASAHDHDDKYLKLSGGDVTGPICRKMAADTSNFELVVGFKKHADDTVLASIGYHNTVQKIFINAIGSNKIYSDTEGKYSLVIGNNHLTYNTKSIWHAGNYTDWINTTNYPGLDKVGTVTSVTLKAGTGISLDTDNTAITTSGTRTITNSGVRAVSLNGDALRVNTNGTNDDLTIPYATNADTLDSYHAKDLYKVFVGGFGAHGGNARWFCVYSMNISNSSDNNAVFMVTSQHDYARRWGILVISARRDGSSISKNYFDCIVNCGLDLTHFKATKTTDGTTIKIYVYSTGWSAYSLTRIAFTSWSGASGDESNFYSAHDKTSGFASIPPSGESLFTQTGNPVDKTYAATAGSVSWDNVTDKTDYTTRWPSWSEVTGKPDSFTPSSHTHDTYVPKISGTGSVVATQTSTYGWAGCKIRIPGGYNPYMIALTLRIYSNYNYTDIVCSGYHYGSNHWHVPNAQIIGGTQRFWVVMGYEGDTSNHLYIWFGYKEGNLGYGGFSIMNLHSGHSAGPDWYSDWTISNVGYSSLTNKQYDASPVLPSMDGHTHDYAASNHNHNSSYVSSLSTSGNYLTWDKNGTTNNITVPYATSAGSAASATTATNLANNPSIQAGTSDTNKVTITAGGKTSSEFTIPYAANAGALGSYSASDLIYCGARNLAPPSWCGVRNSSNEYISFGDPTTIYQTWGLGWYTISFDIKTDVAGSGNLYATPGYGRYVFSQQSITTTTSWTHKVFRINVSDNNNGQSSSISIYLIYGSGAIIHVRNFKMEKGKIETTFSYAPEYYINTDNIGSQSVNYATSAGSASYADSAGSASSATNATYASYVKDIGNSTAISLKYSSGGYTSAPTYLAAWNGYQITYAQATSYVYVKGAKQIEITKYASEGNLYLTGVAGNPSSATYYQPYTLDSFYMCNTSKSYSSTYSSKYLSVPAIEASYINQYPMGGNVVYLGMAYHSNNSTSGSFTSGPSNFFSGSVSRLEAGRYKITITNSSKQTYYIWPFLQVYSNPPTGHPYEIGWAQFDTATTYLQKSVASGSSYNVQVNCGYLHTQGNWSTSDFLATGDGGSSRTVHWTCVFFGTTAY